MDPTLYSKACFMTKNELRYCKSRKFCWTQETTYTYHAFLKKKRREIEMEVRGRENWWTVTVIESIFESEGSRALTTC